MMASPAPEPPPISADQRARRRRDRRFRGLFYLGSSVWLCISGLTWLQARLTGLGFVLYWTLCAGAAILACLVALNDAVLTQAELRAEAREKQREKPE